MIACSHGVALNAPVSEWWEAHDNGVCGPLGSMQFPQNEKLRQRRARIKVAKDIIKCLRTT